MPVELVGVCTYGYDRQGDSGGGRFYLTEQALKDLQWLQQRTEASIDQALNVVPSCCDGGGEGEDE